MSWIAVLLIGIAVADLAHSIRPAPLLDECVGAAVAVWVGLLAGLTDPSDLVALLVIAGVVVGWGQLVTRAFGGGRAWMPLLLLGAALVLGVAVSGVPDPAGGLLGRTETSARDFYPVFKGGVGPPELYAIKWRNYKLHFIWQERKYDVPQTLAIPRLIDLYDNPQERIEETQGESSIETRGWVMHAMFAELGKFQASFKRDPPVPMGALDPYLPPTTDAPGAPDTVPVPPAND